MLWIAYVAVAIIAAGLALWLAMRRRRRPDGPVQASSVQTSSGSASGVEGVYGLKPRELEDFRASARAHTRDQHVSWQRDYPTGGVDGLPGRLAGIPRVLRVKR
ncbi:MAG: hypothetical protein MJE12_24025 [Alphaproteobacteria bacterium]|nr:hypothetical protein [Alphaproteobacteria bacterium]